MNITTTARQPALLVDIEFGTVLDAPPEVTHSWVYLDSHPFIAITPTHVLAGPHAERVAGGAGGADYVLYERIGETAGSLHLKRVE